MGDPGIIPPLKIGGLGSQPPSSAGGPASAWQRSQQIQSAQGIHGRNPLNAGPLQSILNLNQIDLVGRIWTQLQIDRPVILYPVTSNVQAVESGAQIAGAQRPVYFMPNVQTDKLLALLAVPETALTSCQVSKGCGVVYLSAPGRWSIYWDAANNASKCKMMVIDASDPAVAARYLFDDGIHDFSVNTSITVTVGDIELLASSRLRKGFILSQDSSTVTNPIRLGFNAAASSTLGFKIGSANETNVFSMSGENCFKGRIRATRDATAVADVTISVLEWF